MTSCSHLAGSSTLCLQSPSSAYHNTPKPFLPLSHSSSIMTMSPQPPSLPKDIHVPEGTRWPDDPRCTWSIWLKGFISLIKEGWVSLKLSCSLSLVRRFLFQHTAINITTGRRSHKGNMMSSRPLAVFHLVYGSKFLKPGSRLHSPFCLLYKMILCYFIVSWFCIFTYIVTA